MTSTSGNYRSLCMSGNSHIHSLSMASLETPPHFGIRHSCFVQRICSDKRLKLLAELRQKQQSFCLHGCSARPFPCSLGGNRLGDGETNSGFLVPTFGIGGAITPDQVQELSALPGLGAWRSRSLRTRIFPALGRDLAIASSVECDGIARVENNDEMRTIFGFTIAREAVDYSGYFLRKIFVDGNWIYKPGAHTYIGCQTSESDVPVLR